MTRQRQIMNNTQKAIIGVLSVVLIALLIILATLVIQSENKRQSDIQGMATIDAIETRVHSWGD